MSKTPESIDDVMENLTLEIHLHSLSSIDIPVNFRFFNSTTEVRQILQKQSETVTSPTKIRF